MSSRPSPLSAGGSDVESDPTIVHHYVSVLMFEAVIWAGLAWLAAQYR